MFGKKALEIVELKHENAILADRLAQLRHTRIRISRPTAAGLVPLRDTELEYAIMLTNMQGGMGVQIPEGVLEVISQYTPLEIPDAEDEGWINAYYNG
jgi:hypothetical protein